MGKDQRKSKRLLLWTRNRGLTIRFTWNRSNQAAEEEGEEKTWGKEQEGGWALRQLQLPHHQHQGEEEEEAVRRIKEKTLVENVEPLLVENVGGSSGGSSSSTSSNRLNSGFTSTSTTSCTTSGNCRSRGLLLCRFFRWRRVCHHHNRLSQSALLSSNLTTAFVLKGASGNPRAGAARSRTGSKLSFQVFVLSIFQQWVNTWGKEVALLRTKYFRRRKSTQRDDRI